MARRIPNLSYQCVECRRWREAYVRPSKPVPSYCSKSCRQRAAWKRPDFRSKCSEGRSGEKAYQWQGDAVSVRGGRARALRLYRDIGPCVRCGAEPAERHHRDGNTANNAPANIEIICRHCHMEEDGRLEASREQMRRVGHKGNEVRWRTE